MNDPTPTEAWQALRTAFEKDQVIMGGRRVMAALLADHDATEKVLAWYEVGSVTELQERHDIGWNVMCDMQEQAEHRAEAAEAEYEGLLTLLEGLYSILERGDQDIAEEPARSAYLAARAALEAPETPDVA